MIGVSLTPDVERLIAAGSPVAIGVSGGKDSCAAAIATVEHLDHVGHTGPRVLVHADLGRVEWTDSHRTCVRLADHTGTELVVVRRELGDMMDRWLQRWRDNVERYVTLRCVKLILPWSTPDMRFCTSELKIAPICRELKRRYPGTVIVNADGVRWSESKKRKGKPIANAEPGLTHPKLGTSGVHWRPIIAYEAADVFALCAARRFPMHEGYTRFDMDRISCAFCIMQSEADMRNSATNPEHHDLAREMVGLEVVSTFGFHGSKWLADFVPHVLDADTIAAVAASKARAQQRVAIEAVIPEHLEYEDGWPRIMPTGPEAEMLAGRRRALGALFGFDMQYTTGPEVHGRYAELMAENARRASEKAAREARKTARRARGLVVVP